MTPKIIRSTAGQRLMGGRQTIKLSSEDTGEKASVIFSKVPAGSGIPLHIHSREEEIFQITEGQLEVTVGQDVQILEKGDMVFLPKEVPHGFRAIEDTGMWVTLIPGGAEQLFVELAALPPGPPDKEQISRISRGYGIRFVETAI